MIGKLRASLWDMLRQCDLVLLGLCCAAALYGIAMIFSASQFMGPGRVLRHVGVQSAALILGVCAYVGISLLNLELVMKRWKWMAAFNVGFFLLLKTPLGVSDNTGNTAWLKFPFLPVSIGPAEVVKITFVLLLAWQLQWLREERQDLRSFSSALMAAGHALGLAGLYYLVSHDMGNALMFLLIFVAMAFAAGFALRWFLLLLGGAAGGFAAAWYLDLMPRYMRNRFLVLLDHSLDPLDAGWQQTRSLLTLGGGGLFGQGYLHGTQTQGGVGSIPARHTDLIFSVIGEEMGFVGAAAVLILLSAIVARVLLVAHRAEMPFHTYACVGMASMLVFQTVINLGMCLFILPVIGLTLPFFSYGGSSLLMLFCAMGCVSGIEKYSLEYHRIVRKR